MNLHTCVGDLCVREREEWSCGGIAHTIHVKIITLFFADAIYYDVLLIS